MKISLYLIMFALLFFACEKESSGPKESCKISSETENGSGGSEATYYSYVNTKTFERDKANNIIRIAMVSTYTFADNTTSTSNNSETFEYDKDGLMLKDIVDNASIGRDKSNYFNKSTITFEYANKILVKSSTSASNSSGSSSNTNTYQYDNEGRLVKTTYNSITPAASSVVYEFGYSSGRLSTYTTTSNGQTIVQTIETDSKGRVLSTTNIPYMTKYSYDTDGNRTQTEYFNNGKKIYLAKLTYDGKKNIDMLLSPNKKGHPENLLYPMPTSNIVLSENFSYDNAGTEKLDNSISIAYTYNGSGYPVTSTSSSASSTYSTNYEFTDCN